ncbi:hypothetical protein [Salinigranum marinum]|nr:hypothetical protein [Salinigranum marinum]
MATQQHASKRAYSCPRCDGAVVFAHQSWSCVDCGYVPRHAAD